MAPSVEKQQKPIMAAEEEKEEEETYSYAMQLASSIVLPAVLQAVTELDVLEIINKAGPASKLSASEIVSQIPNQNPEAPIMLDRGLRLLVSYNILHCSLVAGERLYSLAPVCKYFLLNQNGVSLRSFMNFNLDDKAMMPMWFQLKNQILEGGTSFHKANGMSIFEYAANDSRFNEAFNNAMIGQSSIATDKIIDSYKGFEHVKQLVDVGGGLGITLSMIISKYPHIKGINFDLPYVIKDAPSYHGVKHVGGDMFEKIPEGDTILMKWVFSGVDDDQCLKLLRNCYNTLPDDGKVLVIDSLLPEVPENSAASRDTSIVDIALLSLIPGAKQRTKQELNAFAIEAGFKSINYEFCACNFYVTEFYK